MTRVRAFDFPAFDRELESRGIKGRLNDIDTCVSVADAAGCWPEELLARAILRTKKEFLRNRLAAGYHDEAGNFVRALGIKELDPGSGEMREGYKQLAFFTADNFEYAIRDAKERFRREGRKFRDLCRLACGRYGFEAMQRRFDFKLPVKEPAA